MSVTARPVGGEVPRPGLAQPDGSHCPASMLSQTQTEPLIQSIIQTEPLKHSHKHTDRATNTVNNTD